MRPRGPAIGRQRQPFDKRAEHGVEILGDVPIGKSNREKAHCGVASVPMGVFRRVVRVPIDLDDQAFGRAEEIDNTTADDMLSAELVAVELAAGEMTPEQRFKRRRGIAESACAIEV